MTPQQINIAIAECCGLRVENNPHYGLDQKLHDSYSLGINGDREIPIPNYCSDLNAMHEAEKTLNNDEYRVWRNILVNLCQETLTTDFAGCRRRSHSATAPQRAEAFLRVKGLWKD